MRRGPDHVLIILTAALTSIGVAMVFSASCALTAASNEYGNNPYFFLIRQSIWVAIGLLALIVTASADLRSLRKFSLVGIAFSMVLLSLVLVPGIGQACMGARRWISLGIISFQPAELAKIFLVLYLADYLARRGRKIVEFRFLLSALMILGVTVFLIEKEPDLGTTLVIGGTFLGMLFIAGARPAHLFGLAAVGTVVVVLRIMNEAYRVKRFLAFLNPWEDPAGSGYHIIQGLIALGSGGIHGLGLGQSRQKFFYLPEQHTDFIFAIIGEEMGLLGTLFILLLFIFLVYRGFKIAILAGDPFLKLLATGMTLLLGIQTLLNLGVVLGVFPCTGIPLPFISFGGSSLLVSMISVGALINISRHCPARALQRPLSPRSFRPQAEGRIPG